MRLVLTVILLFLAFNLWATISPYQPYEKTKFNTIDSSITSIESDVSDLQDESKIITKEYIFDAEALSLTGGQSSILGTLPESSVIVRTMFYIGEAIETDTNNTVAFSCENSGDLFAATALSAELSGTLYDGAINFPNTQSASQTRTALGCNVQIDVGSGESGITNGYLILLIDFFNFEI